MAVSLAAGVVGGMAQTPAGTIAYVMADTRDEIRLVEPDGSNDRRLWINPGDDPSEVYEVWSMAWKPDGTQLTFAGNHESWCSVNNADIFAIHADGTNYRRLTEAPACGDLASYPQGRVEVPVSASILTGFSGFVYVQGASSIQPVSLPPGGSTTVVFENVADFGPGALQIASFLQGSYRKIDVGTAVDVQAGGTVTTGPLSVWELSLYSVWEVHSPTWRYGSDQVAYVLNFNSIKQVSANPDPLDFGSDLLNVDSTARPDFVQHLAYGPTAATASTLLYNGGIASDSENVMRVIEGSTTPGEVLVSHESYDSILGLAWLPDGSGFVYSVKEYSESYVDSANLFVYRFAVGTSQRLTEFSGEFTGRMAVSPDGKTVLFERGLTMNTKLEVEKPDLWMVGIGGSDLRLFKANARTPAWSLVDASTPPAPTPPGGLTHKLFLPLARH